MNIQQVNVTGKHTRIVDVSGVTLRYAWDDIAEPADEGYVPNPRPLDELLADIRAANPTLLKYTIITAGDLEEHYRAPSSDAYDYTINGEPAICWEDISGHLRFLSVEWMGAEADQAMTCEEWFEAREVLDARGWDSLSNLYRCREVLVSDLPQHDSPHDIRLRDLICQPCDGTMCTVMAA